MILALQSVTLHNHHKLICNDLTLNIQLGDVWGVLGPNGCGKSTLLHALAGIQPLTQGEIKLDDKTLTQLPIKYIARNIAILLQDTPYYLPQTIYEHVLTARFPHTAYFKRISAKDHDIVLEALTVMTLQDYATRSSLALSGGEKQRLAIASVLAQTPSCAQNGSMHAVSYMIYTMRTFHGLHLPS